MVMQRLNESETEPQQLLPVVRVCWDDLFRFLQNLFLPRAAKAWTVLESLDAETTTKYKKVFEVGVGAGFQGILDMISLYSDRPDATEWLLEIAGQEQFTDKKAHTALTLSYGGLIIHTAQKIVLRAKTDGAATNLSGALSGRLHYLG